MRINFARQDMENRAKMRAAGGGTLRSILDEPPLRPFEDGGAGAGYLEKLLSNRDAYEGVLAYLESEREQVQSRLYSTAKAALVSQEPHRARGLILYGRLEALEALIEAVKALRE